jgi:predicted signal transduction protein with EAL and GGDEF domain
LIGPTRLKVTASIGLAIVPTGTAVSVAVAAADAALYRAKQNGRDRVEQATAEEVANAVPEESLADAPAAPQRRVV